MTIPNPTTFFIRGYPGISWQSKKTAYDPCPAGWRVPDGGENGIWKTAGFANTTFDYTNCGVSFSITSQETTWYPASGILSEDDGVLKDCGTGGGYWYVPNDGDIYKAFSVGSFSYKINHNDIKDGYSVRCLKE